MATNDGKSTNTNENSGPEAAPARKKSKALLFVALALVLAAGGAGCYFFGRKTVAAKNDPPKPATILHLDNFIVNLADTDRDAYLRVGIDLGVTGIAQPKSGDSKTAEPVPQIRDAILSVLSTYHSSDLLTPAGKKQLKENLIAALNGKVPELGVRDIYFTDFLVQR
ncbi:MAG: flagellar basal body-associated FliL family protein [Acidobacteriota bacterium]|nr:flagellar basal body-associated FliL family protein [Acidobacteriota bacterium]